jgi:hypothetical protein
MKSWKWALLIFELVLVAVILILPQVELPDFTFHGGNSPIAAKQRITPHGSTAIFTANVALPVSHPDFVELSPSALGTGLISPLASSLSLSCVLIC